MNHPIIFQSIWRSGTACIAVASAIYSVAAALVRPLSDDISVLQVVAVRSLLSLAFSYIAYKASGQESPLFGHRSNMSFLAARGLIGSLAMDMFYSCLFLLPMGDAVSLLFCNPVLTALLAWAVLHESLTWRGCLGCVSSFIGMIFVVRPPFLFGDLEEDVLENSSSSSTLGGVDEREQRRIWGSLFGIASAFLAAGAYISIRMIGSKETPLTVAVWFHTSALAHSAAFLAFGWPFAAVLPTPKDWLCLLGIAVSSFAANVLLNRGFQLESAALASGVNMTQVLYSHLIGAVVFGEQASWLGVLGAVLIGSGVLAVAVDGKREEQAKEKHRASLLVVVPSKDTGSGSVEVVELLGNSSRNKNDDGGGDERSWLLNSSSPPSPNKS